MLNITNILIIKCVQPLTYLDLIWNFIIWFYLFNNVKNKSPTLV